MKKLKVLAIMLATVLSFSVGAFAVGCDTDKPEPGPNGGDTDVPVADGKVTFYFTLADGSVEIPEYAAVFYAGGLTGWATGDAAPAFTQLDDTNVYYVQLEADTTLDNYNEYTLILGYSAASGLPADKQGVVWDNDNKKSDECQAYPYGSNATFTMAEGATTVNLGTHTFSTALSAPQTVDEVTLKVTFAEALDDTDEVYIMGGFNGWDWAKAKTTANETYTTYSLELTDILCTNYEYKIVILASGDNVVTEDEEGNALTGWDQYYEDITGIKLPDGSQIPEGSTAYARTEISAGGSNLSVSIIKRDDGSSVDLAGTISEALDGIEIKGLDLSKAVWTEGKTKNEEGEEVGNGKFTHILSLAATKTLKVEFTEALPEDVDLYIIGSFLDSTWATTVGQARMVIAADRMSASVDYEVLPASYQFNMIFLHKDIELPEDSSSTVQAIWDYGVKASAENLTVKVEGYEEGVVDLVADKLTVPTVPAPETAENVTLKVTFANAVADDKHVVIAGSFNGWGDGDEMTANDDRTEFTLTVSKIVAKKYEFKVSVSDDTSMDWKNAWGAAEGGNASFTVGEANSNTTVELFAAALEN